MLTRPSFKETGIGLALTSTHLYTCFVYNHYNTESNTENMITQHSRSDGSKTNRAEYRFTFSMANCLLFYQ